ncbi:MULTISPECIES: DNA-methyltransferase [unclassified Coleofasciculus]|uniref:DNA-methyltransferase n=1 Tax=unclassified Coleofasciculus TaxID=2692782 RepID=UPI00187EC65C|nr:MULTISPECIES: site-specific DNA-methyltransferase [unclassified Coleofasciculus]MBE9124996.1 site-specific DNA-methyltransferase [Coleofasciculus sp. LEGE 07081]MBE9147684.1 site-specific DNA-methyltransferase [Coleofasciculus sp. LEGE 07092]
MLPFQLIPTDVATQQGLQQVYVSKHGILYQGDCLKLLSALPDESVDIIFADPPFNLGKKYGEGVSDQMEVNKYLSWSKQWLGESIRLLKPGGSLFVFNLPKWCIEYGAYLNQQGMWFRHWIACRMPKAFPRGKRMSPAHYGLIYYTKGEPLVFNKVYTPIQVCRHCGGEIRDYGGHRKKLNEKGINLMDVWDTSDDVWEDAPEADANEVLWTLTEEMWADIPPVRHRRHKKRVPNELAPIMLERIIAMASNPGQIVVDPFGGSGTTFYAAEKLHRYWIGSEIGDTAPAVERLTDLTNGIIEQWESARGSKKLKQPETTALQLSIPYST